MHTCYVLPEVPAHVVYASLHACARAIRCMMGVHTGRQALGSAGATGAPVSEPACALWVYQTDRLPSVRPCTCFSGSGTLLVQRIGWQAYPHMYFQACEFLVPGGLCADVPARVLADCDCADVARCTWTNRWGCASNAAMMVELTSSNPIPKLGTLTAGLRCAAAHASGSAVPFLERVSSWKWT